MMQFSAMNKEQKQKLFLFVLLGLGALYAAFQFGVKPLLDGMGDSARALEDLKAQFEQAQVAIHNEAQLDAQVKACRTELEHDFRDFMPPTDNALSWAMAFIYGHAREMGVDITAVSETEVGGTVGWTQQEQAKRLFKPYAVRMELSCSYGQFVSYLSALHAGNPLLGVNAMTITADPRTPEKHAITVVLEWPSWKDPKVGQNPFEQGNPAPAAPASKKEATGA